MLPDYQSTTFAKWRSAAGDAWTNYVQHPFVKGLEDGSLPREAFIHYLIQDYIFLVHFTRAWALAVVKAKTPEQMRTAAATVHALINEEIQLHIGICEREAITEAQLLQAQEAPENLAYTRYVMDAGVSGDMLDLLAALSPCVMGYGEIGLQLSGSTDTTPLYREWIDTYASAEYRDVCQIVGKLIEDVTQHTLGDAPETNPRWSSLCKHFTTASHLEANFWQMGLRLAQEN